MKKDNETHTIEDVYKEIVDLKRWVKLMLCKCGKDYVHSDCPIHNLRTY